MPPLVLIVLAWLLLNIKLLKSVKKHFLRN